MSAPTRLIGVDCAANPKNVGLAAGYLDGGKLVITHAEPGKKAWCDIDDQVKQWIKQGIKEEQQVLLAIDAPLGWPKSLSKSLCRHKAGRAFSTPADQLFKRATDRWVRDKIKQKPLEIGADWIARTAYSALSFLLRLRNETGCAIPLAWEPERVKGVSVIEVYPAATLKGRDISNADCRGKEGAERQKCIADWREDVINRLGVNGVWLSEDVVKNRSVLENDHVFDAVLCVQAAVDFAKGCVVSPYEAEVDGTKVSTKRAKKEGWIWVNWLISVDE